MQLAVQLSFLTFSRALLVSDTRRAKDTFGTCCWTSRRCRSVDIHNKYSRTRCCLLCGHQRRAFLHSWLDCSVADYLTGHDLTDSIIRLLSSDVCPVLCADPGVISERYIPRAHIPELGQMAYELPAALRPLLITRHMHAFLTSHISCCGC